MKFFGIEIKASDGVRNDGLIIRSKSGKHFVSIDFGQAETYYVKGFLDKKGVIRITEHGRLTND